MADKDKTKDKTRDQTFASRGQEVLRTYRAKTRTPSMHEYDVSSIIKRNDEALASIITATDKTDEEKRVQISQIAAQSNELIKLQASLEQRRGAGAEKTLRTGMRTAVGVRQTKEDISRVAHSAAEYGDVVKMAESSSSALEKRQQHLDINIDKQRQRIIEATEAENLDVRKISALNIQMDKMKQEQGLVTGAIAHQRKMGTDIKSVHQAAALYTHKLEESMISDVERQKVREGRAGTAKNLREELDVESKKLIATFKELDKAIKNNASNVDELSKEFEDIKSNIKSKETQLDEMKRLGVGGPGGRGGAIIGAVGEGMQMLGPVIQSGANIYRQWTITQEMDKTRLQTGIAGAANQRFMDSAAAARGDMAALMRTSGGTYNRAAEFAKEMSDKEYKASVASAIGSGTSATGALITGALSGAAKGAIVGSIIPGIGTGVGAAIGGTLGAISSSAGGIEQTSGQVAKLQSGATKTEAFLDAYQAKIAQETAQQQITAYVRQQAMDYTRGSWTATSGAGGARGGILQDLRGVEFQRNMALQYGLSQQEVMGLTQAGLGALGRQFRTSDVAAAGRTAKAGLLAPEEYMNLRGQIAGAGGNTRDLEAILKNAVATGMDSSKNIGEMTRGIFSISARTSAGGISTFGGAAARAGAVFGALESMGVSEAQRAGITADIGKTYEDVLNRRQVDIPSLVQSAEMFSKLGLRAGTIGAEAGAKLKPQQAAQIMKEMKGLYPEEQRKVLEKHGLSDWAREIEAGGKTVSEETLREQANINLRKTLTEKTQSFAWDKEKHARLMDVATRLGDPNLSEEDKKRADTEFRSITQAIYGRPESFEAFAAFGNLDVEAKKRDYSGKTGRKELVTPEDAAFEAQQAGALAGVTEYAEGLKSVNGNLHEITSAMKAQAEVLKPENFKSLVDSSANLDTSVQNLAKVVDALALQAQGRNRDAQDLLRQVNSRQGN